MIALGAQEAHCAGPGASDVDVVLVSELPRWGRSTIDLFHTLGKFQAWGISMIAQTGLQFDLGTPQRKLIASLMSVLAEFDAGTCGCWAIVPGGWTAAWHQQEHGAGHRQARPRKASRITG